MSAPRFHGARNYVHDEVVPDTLVAGRLGQMIATVHAEKRGGAICVLEPESGQSKKRLFGRPRPVSTGFSATASFQCSTVRRSNDAPVFLELLVVAPSGADDAGALIGSLHQRGVLPGGFESDDFGPGTLGLSWPDSRRLAPQQIAVLMLETLAMTGAPQPTGRWIVSWLSTDTDFSFARPS